MHGQDGHVLAPLPPTCLQAIRVAADCSVGKDAVSGSALLQDQGENVKKWDRVHLLHPGLFVLFSNTQKSFFLRHFEFLKAHGDMNHVFMVYHIFMFLEIHVA